ncbi:MAG TPA: efflux transporter outer membrane subunit [Rhizomicrobium sp.]|jgi:NodT family efflux transporter outer membrane factor (OMF) lipoprotein
MTYLRRADTSPLAAPSSLRMKASVAVLTLALAGCAVGPDYKKPAAPDVSSYTAAPLSNTVATPYVTGGDAQHFTEGGDLSADWWTLFHSKPLDDLVVLALTNNHDLKAAQAALKAARENTAAGRGAYFPNVSASFSATREQDPRGALAPVPSNNAFLYNLFTPQVSVSYVPDVFGLNRRTVESLEAQEKSVRFQMFATYTTLMSHVVVTAIQEASTQAQIDATHQLIDIDTKMVDIIEYQLKKGYASGLDLAAQKSQLAQTVASLPPLMKQLAQQHDQLAVLTGRFPSQAAPENITLASLQLPQDIPVSLPSTLVEQRPDVRQAESNLHAASAQIGVAVANRLPNIQLTATAGSTALAMSQLFTPGTEFWNIGAALTAPIFQGGTLLHEERAARANYTQAAEQYRSTVLQAFQNVADTLTALQQDAEALKAAANALDAAKVTLDLSQRQYKDGYAGYLSLLTAEQAYQQAVIALVQAQTDRYADTAALFQALGGGWWHHTDLAKDQG